jgi:hypothetical protein
VQVAAVFLLQRRYCLADVAVEQRRVLPLERLAKRRRGDVLRPRVQGLGELLLLLSGIRPMGSKDLVGAPPEQVAAR